MADTRYAPGSVKTFACPGCGGTINIRAVGISITAVCQSCGSIVDIANEELSIISKARANAARANLLLPIGARGHLFDADWEVIGYQQRGDSENTYFWSEYLLFNPWQGFRFLVESDGHWTFIKMLRQDVDGAEYGGRTYKDFSGDTIKVRYVLGEFYWRTKVGDKCEVEDFVAPPYILSREETDQDIIWSQGVYVRPQVIQDAFDIKEKWASPRGIAPNQPNPVGPTLGKAGIITGIAVVCLVILQIISASQAKNQVLIDTLVSTSSAQSGVPQTTDAFDIPGRTGNLEILISSPVDNEWVEVESELINQTTQENDQSLQTVEYYHGYDSDGAWSEGSQVNTNLLSAVPGGRYRLLLTTDAAAFANTFTSAQPVQYRLRVRRDVEDFSNFWTAFLLLIGFSAALLLYYWYFEKQRWANSDDS